MNTQYEIIRKFLTQSKRYRWLVRMPAVILFVITAVRAQLQEGYYRFPYYLALAVIAAFVAHSIIVNASGVSQALDNIFKKDIEAVNENLQLKFGEISDNSFINISCSQCIAEENSVIRIIKNKLFVSSNAFVNVLAIDKKSKKISGYIIKYDFINSARDDFSFDLLFEDILDLNSSEISYSKDGVSYKLILLEIKADDNIYKIYLKDDMETEQLIDYLSEKIRKN